MKKATLIKDNLKNFKGHAALYRLSEPLENYTWGDQKPESYEYVVCSTAYAFGVETYIFGANEKGEIVYWGELPGSMENTSSHEEALNEAGYELGVLVENEA